MHTRNTIPVLFGMITVAIIAIMTWSLRVFSHYQPYSGFFGTSVNINHGYAILLDDVAVKGRQSGKPAWRVTAQRMTLSLDRSRLVAEGIRNGALMQNGRQVARLQADQAIYTAGIINAQNGNLEVVGKIDVASTTPLQPLDAQIDVHASRAFWNGASATLNFPEPVTATVLKKAWHGPISIDAQSVDWNNSTRSLHFAKSVHVICPSPAGAGQIAVSASDVTWDQGTSQLSCGAQVHIEGPMKGSPLPGVVDAGGAVWDQSARTLTCAKPVRARFVLAETNSTVDVSARTAVWRPDTGQLTAPDAISADVSSLGTIDCASASINTLTRSVDFARMCVAADAQRIDNASTPTVPPAPPAPNPQEPAIDPNRVFVTAPEGGHWDEQEGTLVLRGPVTFTQGDATMKTVGANYDKKTSTAKALAPVQISDDASSVTGDHGTIDFKKKVATISGNVHLKQVPKDTVKPVNNDSQNMDSTAKQPTDLDCDNIVYDYKAKTAVATGHLTVTQKHRVVTADTGHYDANTKIAKLDGNVVGKSDDGKILRAPTATVSIKKGDEWLDFPSAVNFDFTPEEDDKDTKSKSGK